MDWKPVESSNLNLVGFDPDKSVMGVEFHPAKGEANGRIYLYPDVEAEEHAALMNAPSKGAHFHQNFVKPGEAVHEDTLTVMAVQINPIKLNPDQVPGGGDVYEDRAWGQVESSINRAAGVAQQQMTQIATLEQTISNLPNFLLGLAPRASNPVEATSSTGTGPNLAYDDHAHEGVSLLIGTMGGVSGNATLTGPGVIQNSATFTFPGIGGVGALNVLTNPGGGYNVVATDVVIAIVGGPGGAGNPITLPQASANANRAIWIKNTGSGAASYRVVPHAGDTLDVGANFDLFISPVNFAGCIFMADAVNGIWYTWGVS